MAEMLDIVAHLQNAVNHQEAMIRDLRAQLPPPPTPAAAKVLSMTRNKCDLDQATSDLGSTSTLGSSDDKDRDTHEIVVKARKKIRPHLPPPTPQPQVPPPAAPRPTSVASFDDSLPKSRDVSALREKMQAAAMRGTPLGKLDVHSLLCPANTTTIVLTRVHHVLLLSLSLDVPCAHKASTPNESLMKHFQTRLRQRDCSWSLILERSRHSAGSITSSRSAASSYHGHHHRLDFNSRRHPLDNDHAHFHDIPLDNVSI